MDEGHAGAPGAPDAGRDAAGSPAGIPHDTTPTWEMELLLSGATVFGLLQLPRQLDLHLFDILGRLPEDLGAFALIAWAYSKTAVLVVIATFLLHLVLRGFWIALVGLDSVYPGGIRWERLKMGALQRRAAEEMSPAMVDRIERADNRASRVFGVGVGLALLVLVPLGVVLAGLLCYAIARGIGADHARSVSIFFAASGLILGPFALLHGFDRLFGARLSPDGAPARTLRAAFRGYTRLGFGRAANPLVALFQSHQPRAGFLTFAVFAVITGGVMAQFIALQEGWSLGDFAGLPNDEPGTADTILPEHYASMRAAEPVAAPRPFIQDRVAKGPYVELFVPYRARTHAAALRAACPAAVREAEAGKSARPALDCLAGILDVRLDGEPVSVRLDATEDRVSGQRGVVAMIPVASLAPGRHELTVRAPALPKAKPPPRLYRIPFWR